MEKLKELFSKKNLCIMAVSGCLGLYLAVYLGKLLRPVSEQTNAIAGLGFLQFMIFIMSMVAPIAIASKSKGFNSKYGDQGTAKEGSLGELRSLSGKDGFVVSKNFRLSGDKSYEHVAIIGPTGSGKSTSFFIPNLLDLDGEKSAVVTDPKGEMYEKTSGYLKSLGYTVIKLSPLKPSESDRHYNPLLIAKDTNELKEIAQLILTNGGKATELMSGASSGGADWINMAIPLLAAAFCYVREAGTYKTIDEAIQMILGDDLKTLKLKMSKVPSAQRNFNLFLASSESEKTMSSIKSVLATNIQIFTDDNVIEFTKTPMETNAYGDLVLSKRQIFNPTILRKKPTVVFVCVEEIKSYYAMPLMSVFYSQVLEKCMSTDGQPVLFYLDEFANIGIIPSISTIVATARSRKIGISLGLQGVEQLKRNYGDHNASDILNNLKTKVVYSGLTGDSADYISNLAGVTTIESKSTSSQGEFFGQQNISKQGVSRNLIMPDEIRRMSPDKVLIIAHDKNPVYDSKNTYYNQKKYTKKLES